MLRLVHPPPGGNGSDPPARRKRSRSPALRLTAEEARHARAFLRNTSRAFGGHDVLAAVLGVPAGLVRKAVQPRQVPSPALVLRVAQTAGVSVEGVLSGAITDASRCKACGSRIASGRVAAAGGAR